MTVRDCIEDYVKLTRMAVIIHTYSMGEAKYHVEELRTLHRMLGLSQEESDYCMKDLHIENGIVKLD